MKMKQTPHGLKIDKRKTLYNNLKANGLTEPMTENKSENSPYVKIKNSQIRKFSRKLDETTDHDKREYIRAEIEKREQQIENYLK